MKATYKSTTTKSNQNDLVAIAVPIIRSHRNRHGGPIRLRIPIRAAHLKEDKVAAMLRGATVHGAFTPGGDLGHPVGAALLPRLRVDTTSGSQGGGGG